MGIPTAAQGLDEARNISALVYQTSVLGMTLHFRLLGYEI